MPTREQLAIIHIAKSQIGLDEPSYRLILKNVGKVYSAKQLDNAGIENVMAFFEGRGFVDSKNGAGYWTRKVEQRGTGVANERQVQLINRLAKTCRYCVPAMCEQFSKDRTQFPEKLTTNEARMLIEMMKGSIARDEAKRQEAEHAQPALPF